MDKGQRFIGCLLVVIAALLAVNIFAKTEQRAEAQYGAAGPVDPVVVAGQVFTFGSGRHVWRFWSDGSVDITLAIEQSGCDFPIGCGPAPVIPGSCPSDVTRNGEVEFNDMLNVLSDWGPCE